jgi:microcystin-dependent protein
MSEPFLSEIKIVSFNFPPKGWALCNGQLLPINQNQALFALLGTTYGGDGRTNFALPNLRGKLPLHFGPAHTLGETAGSTSVTLSIQQTPTHTHMINATNNAGNSNNAAGSVLAQGANVYGDGPPAAGNIALNAASVTAAGGSQPHSNMMPYLVMNFVIALQGIFPSPN